MKRIVAVLAVLTLGLNVALAAPIVPPIASHDFNFGASEPANVPFYDPRGADSDYLTLSQDDLDQEATAFWEIWPVGGTPLPIYNLVDAFGGDFELYLEFDGEDAIPPYLDVSITGAGRMAGADLVISGKMPDLGINNYEVLVAIDITDASLYGYGNQSSFVLETLGVFTDVNPLLPGANDLIGAIASSRGNIDYTELALPIGYNPLVDYMLAADGGGYSGEVGLMPEPATLLTLLSGAFVALRWRR